MPALRGEPRLGQWILIGLMGLAFAAILLARIPFGSGGAGAGGTKVLPGAAATTSAATARPATARPTTAPAATIAPERTLVPTEVKPTKKPGTTAKPTTGAATTYKVKRGDTLSGIALKYDTTWQVLAELNDIKDAGSLRVGQVLQLP